MQDTYNEVRNAFAARQQLVRNNALADQQRATDQTAGGQMASGDFPGAAGTLYRSGDLAGGQKVQAYSDTQRQQHAEAAQRITKGIRAAVNAGHTTAEAYDMATQAAPALGIDPAELQKLRPAYDKDPRAFLDFVEAQSAKELSPYTLSQGQTRYDENNKEVASVAPEQKYVTLSEGAKAVPIPGTGSTPAAAPGIPAPANPNGGGVQTADPAAAVDGFVKDNGATITSGLRTPAHNAEVGGVPNSRHLTDQARDIVPPAGMTMAQLGANIQQQIPGAKVLVEKDHVHVQWGGSAAPKAATAPTSGDPPGTLYGNPKEKTPDEAPLSPTAVAMVGQQYLSLGPSALQNMGQGKVGVANKNRVMEWAATTAREAGTSNPQLVARFAQNKANVAALNQNTKSLTAVSASEHTLDANLDYAMSFAKRGVGPTGLPLFDTPINKLRMQVGSVDAKNLDNLLTTTTAEYARILTTSTGTGGGATSDRASEEAHKLLNSGMTLRQLTDAVKIAKTEAANRKASYVGENARLTSEISGIPQQPAQSAAPSPPPGKRPPLSAFQRR